MDSNAAQLEVSSRSGAEAKVHRPLIALAFTVAVFLSAALLFVVEPMFGKMVLPLLGGSPAVWTTCMVFFQGALLLGYLYAHIGPRWLGLRRHTVMHIVLLALCFFVLPISVAATAGTFRLEHPNVWLLWVLTLSLGAPFVLLSSTGPLLQVWFSKTSHPEAERPYFLYAASNAGSLLALLSYPFLIEPLITLRGQSRLWSLGFLFLIVVVAIAAAYLRTGATVRGSVSATSQATARIGTRRMLRWTVLAFVPSSFFLALTTFITTDVAAVPLLWIIPLVLYLLSFTMVFGRRRLLSHTMLVRWQPVGLITLVIIGFWGTSASAPILVPLHLIVFFVTALVCHGELANTKPHPSRLTEFYLCLAVGGVLGGVFNALMAPALFDSVLEYPLTLLIACAVRPRFSEGPSSSSRMGWNLGLITVACAVLVWSRLGDAPKLAVPLAVISSAIAAMACLRMSRNPARFTLALGLIVLAGLVTERARPGILLKERNFFGVREVREDAGKQLRMLMHGTTSHGAQSMLPSRRSEPVSYYHRPGPVGDVFRALPPAPGRRVGIIGLGAGGLVAYAGRGEEWTFFEIDPDIARVARDTNYFTYLEDTPAKVDIVLGDARLSLAQVPDHFYDILVLDAFSSDAIPTHLLTLEALSLYRRKLSDKGVLVMHLSNRYLDLEPAVARLIQATRAAGLIRDNTDHTPQLEASGDPSIWTAIAAQRSNLGPLQNNPKWRPLGLRDNVALWTDDFSNIFSVFRWSLPGLRRAEAGQKAPDKASENATVKPGFNPR
jgi:hypothetical protein